MSRAAVASLAGVAIAVTLALAPAAARADTPTPTSTPADAALAAACAEADELIADSPTTALALIDALRAAAADACAAEWVRATAQAAVAPVSPFAGGITEDDVCSTAQKLADVGLHAEALAFIDAARAAASGAIAKGEPVDAQLAVACEKQRSSIAVQGTSATPTPVPTPDAKAVGAAWGEFVAVTVAPLVGAGVFIASTWVVLLFAARLSAVAWPRGVKSTRAGRRAAAVAGIIIIAGIPVWAALVGAGSELPAPTPTPTAAVADAVPNAKDEAGAATAPVAPGLVEANRSGLAVALILVVGGGAGVALAGYGFATRRKVQVTLSGETDQKFSHGFSAILRDMGGEPARGLEIPVGPDIPDLDTSVLDLTKAKGIVSFVQTVWKAVSSISPWNLTVSADEPSSVTFALTRNGKLVDSDRILADDPRFMLDEAVDAEPDERLATVVAARVIAALRAVYPREWSMPLHGATAAKGIALQYLATRWHSGWDRRQTAIRLLTTAQQADPRSRSVRVALSNRLYRDSVRESDMRMYSVWLAEQIALEISLTSGERVADIDALSENDLLLRLLLTQGAVARNLSALGVAPSRDDEGRARLLLNLLEARPNDEAAPGDAMRRMLAVINEARIVTARSREQGTPIAASGDGVTPGAAATDSGEGADRAARAGSTKGLGKLLRVDLMRRRASADLVTSWSPDDDEYRRGRPAIDGVDGIRATAAPEVAYSLACHYVRDAEEQELDRGRLLTSGSHAPLLRRLLGIAFVDPELRRWAASDPELRYVRRQKAFRRLIGDIGQPDVSDAPLHVVAAGKDRLDGFASAAVSLLAERKVTEIAQLVGCYGSPRWDALERSVWAGLHERYAFDADPVRVRRWMMTVAGIGADTGRGEQKSGEDDPAREPDPPESGEKETGEKKTGEKKPGARGG